MRTAMMPPRTAQYWPAGCSITATVPGRAPWEPTEPGLVPQKSPKAPAVAGEANRRLQQMRELARSFKAHEFYAPWPPYVPDRYELRLLPQPILRYDDPDAGLIDGAVFLLVYGRNPEIVLTIEANRAEGSEPTWTYSLGRMSSAELYVNLDDREVWKQMGRARQLDRASYGCFLLPRSVD